MYCKDLGSENGCKWYMMIDGEGEKLAATVPGSVYQDLMDNKKMDDPYYRDNELKALQMMEHDFVYVTEFTPDEKVKKSKTVLLKFHGVDTLADIYLNGELLASVANMHRTFEFPVKNALRDGVNELKVVLHSPTKFIREAYEARMIDGTSDAMRGFPYLRKAHCMFGWDWGPRLPDAGIWRKVELVCFEDARLDGVYVTQKHSENRVDLQIRIDVEKSGEERILSFGKDDAKLSGIDKVVRVITPTGEVLSSGNIVGGDASDEVTVMNPSIWWPNGLGDHPLYTVEVDLLQNGEVIDTWKNRIGLRTLTIHIEKDQYGESFAHEVNGIKVFAMGADYIPEDNILPRINRERTKHLLEQAKLANFNSIRVWGGGYYPGDEFWDLCDEMGFIVWEDFMFACAVYQLTEEFEQNIVAELTDNVKRIRHHACLGLWCGNNEMESFVHDGTWVHRPEEKNDYVKMYEYIFPKLMKQLDPNTFYWPSSPSTGGNFDEPNCSHRGDSHYWDVWHGNKPFTEYRKFFFRYASEFGFQSFPTLKTVEAFTEPEDRNIFSYVMEKHQRNSSANGKIMNYMEQTFLYPTSFPVMLYASQLLQAEAMRYGVEHFRRNRGRCMGAVIWQFNDCWPVASWATIDYYGRWKAVHYYAKRFFAPLMISCEEEGILTQDTNPNAEPYEVKKSIRLNVTNETLKDKSVKVKWNLRNNKAEVLRGGECVINVPAMSAVWLDREDCMDADLYGDYVSYSCEEVDATGSERSEGTVLFCPPKHYRFLNPELTVRLEGDEIVVSAKSYAKSVEVLNENEDLVLADNYFDMNAGERRLKIISGDPKNLRVRSVFDIR